MFYINYLLFYNIFFICLSHKFKTQNNESIKSKTI